MTVRFSVTVRQVREDGTEVPAGEELAAALAGPAEQFAGLLSWAGEEARFLDHGEREDVIGQEGRELQRRLLPSPPPSPPSPRKPATAPASATPASPAWTGPSPTSRTTTGT